MFFVSTRNSKVLCKFKDTILDVMAEQQGGLFTPSFLTPMDQEQLYQLGHKKYTDILIELLFQFCDNALSKQTLTTIVNNAYKDFNRGFGVPNNNLNLQFDGVFSMQTFEDNIEIANLTYGPTGCVKDYGYCLSAELINYFSEKENKVRTVIDISGGSSGPSVAWAIRNKKFLKGFTLLRNTKNPSVKALIAMANKDADNIGYSSTECDGNFINAIRYDISNNTSLRELANLTFINELNLINIFSYLPVFFKAYIRCNMKPFCVSLPTGNLSLGLSAFFAKKLGIPIRKIILATEKNDFLYEIQESKVAINNNDTIEGFSCLHTNIPTNFERLLFYLYESNQGSVKRAMQELESNGRYKINSGLFAKFQEHFFVAKCDNQFNIRNTIHSAIREKELYVEQHFAISKMAIDVAQGAIPEEISNTPIVIFNTMDYRRNIDFVNASIGYDLEQVKYPWTDFDVKQYSPTEIKNDKLLILRYIIDALEDATKLKQVAVEKKEEE